MLASLRLGALLAISLFAAGAAQAVELNPQRYDIYVGHVDDNGKQDFYFHGKPLTLILHGDIATPIVLPAPTSFVVYHDKLRDTPVGPVNDNHGYYAPEELSLTEARMQELGLRLYTKSIDFFAGDFNGDRRNDWLIRGVTSEFPAFILATSAIPGALPTMHHQYSGVNQLPVELSDRSRVIRIRDTNDDGKDDIVVPASSSAYADVAYLSDSEGIPRLYAPANTVPAVTSPSLVGSTAGEFRVDESGAATYSIPLALPEGTAGVTPQLALTYSSQAGNGLLGKGWNLSGTSGISRCRQTLGMDGVAKPISWTDEDRFCLDDQRLVLESGTYGAPDATYKTAIDSFATVTSHGGTAGNPGYFSVERKDGSLSYYGHTPDSKKTLPGDTSKVLAWMQTSFADNVGNLIRFTYNTAGGHRLSGISYAFNSSGSAGAVVNFLYENRTDIIRGYQSGSELTVSKRLSQIVVKNLVNESDTSLTEVRRYHLRYLRVADDKLHINTSRLSSIQECVGSKCLPATSLAWTDPAIGFSATPDGTIPLPSGLDDRYLRTYAPGDINGDGNIDLAYIELERVSDTSLDFYHRVYYAFSDGDSIGSPIFIASFTGEAQASTRISMLDYNADGRQDLAYYFPHESGGRWVVKLSAPQSDGRWLLNDRVELPFATSRVSFGDINSDGLVDAIFSNGYRPLVPDPAKEITSNSYYHFGDFRALPWGGADELGTPEGYAYCQKDYDSFAVKPALVGDFNGDGGVDIVGTHTKGFSCWKNSTDPNSGRPDAQPQLTAVYALAYNQGGTGSLERYARIEGWHARMQIVDINGDGLSDAFFSINDSFYYIINNGVGFNAPVATGISYDVKAGFTDYNMDGASDLYWHAGSQLFVRIWDGTAFEEAQVVQHTYASRDKDSHFFIDMNGDGQSDYVQVTNRNIKTYLGNQPLGGGAPDAIVTIDNGLGNVTDINYGTLGRSGHYSRMDVETQTSTYTGIGFPGGCTSSSNCTPTEYTYTVTTADEFYRKLNGGWDLPAGSVTVGDNTSKDHPTLEVTGSVYVVTGVASTAPRARTNPGSTDYSAKSHVSYYYGEAKMQASGRGFLGFQKLKTVDHQSGIATTTTYRQDYPFIGRPLSTQVFSSDGPGGVLLSQSVNTWNFKDPDAIDGTKRYQPYLDTSVEETYDLVDDGVTQGALLTTIITEQTYDNYGNPLNIRATTTGSDGTSQVQNTNNTYGGETNAWYNEMGRLTETVVTTTRGADSLTRQSKFTYYESDGALLDSAGGHGFRGLLKEAIVEPVEEADPPSELAFEQTTEYRYDEFGNKWKVTQKANGVSDRSSRVEYDTRGRYVTEKYNALDQLVEQVTARHMTGAPTEIVNINGVTATIDYDDLGRAKSLKDGTGGSVETVYSLCGWSCPPGAVYSVEQTTAGGGVSTEYFDALGRTIRNAHVGFSGRWIYTNTEYDSLGRVVHQSTPYRAGDTPAGWTKQSYDLLGRPVETTLPDTTRGGLVTRSGFTTTTVNGAGQRKIETHDALGNLVSVTDHLAGTIKYTYDLAGNLRTAVTNAPNVSPVTVQMCYDKLGRKVAMHDPDKGGFLGNADATCADVVQNEKSGWWHYRYNGFGELTWQKDTKGQTRNMTYDKLGRMLSRTDRTAANAVEGHTTWHYDTRLDETVENATTESRNLGNLMTVVQGTSISDTSCGRFYSADESTRNYCAQYFYDDYGREINKEVWHPNESAGYGTGTTYDEKGRVSQQLDELHDPLLHPSLLESGTQQHYNNYGYKYRVTDIATGDELYKILAMNERSQVTQELRGNGVTTTYEYDPYFGHLKRQKSDVTAGLPIQEIDYGWDQLGNLTYRHNQSVDKDSNSQRNLKESFCYDGLNRLIKTHRDTLTGACTSIEQDVRYDGLGNITYKADVGSYTYGTNAGPHAVTAAGNATYTYDNNGNMIGGDGRTLVYSTFDKSTSISKGDHVTRFNYGPDRSRYKREDVDANTNKVLKTTLYLGNVERIHKAGSSTIEWRRTVAGTIYTVTTDLNRNIQGSTDKAFIYKDHLGSMDVITDHEATVLQSMSFDPWGQRRKASTWQLFTTDQLIGFDTSLTSRGYTGHEQLDEVGLIHMNGRVYDPKLARFLQADPFIQAASNTQSYNRYSYLLNNPLNATDPSGFFFKKLWNKIRPFVGAIVGIVLAVYCPPCTASIWGAMGAGAVAGAAGAAANGGNILRGALTGAITAAAFYGVGSAFEACTSCIAAEGAGTFGTALKAGAFAGKVLAHAVVGGVMADLQGGKFGHGFMAAGVTQAFSGKIDSIGGAKGSAGWASGSNRAARIAAAAALGGTASKLSGGKFANGAITGAFSRAFNDEAHIERSMKTKTAYVGGFGDDGNEFVKGMYDKYGQEGDVYFEWHQGKELAAWIDSNQEFNLTVIGHSYGGDTVATIVSKGHYVDNLITVDPVGRTKPNFEAVAEHSGTWTNYNAVGGGRMNMNNFVARVGGHWGDRPGNFADSHHRVDADHVQACLIHCRP
jgi:RHS repeat-associated protein